MRDTDPTITFPDQLAVDKLHEIAAYEPYIEYAEEKGPLSIAELPSDIRMSPEFREVVELFGWPSRLEDDDIDPIFEYESVEAFVEALREEGEPYLSNLNAIFAAEPTLKFVMKNVYGLKPPLHRAYVVAPDLFEAIRGLYRAFPVLQGAEDLTKLLREDLVVAEQLMKAFRILARLIKTTDLDAEMKLVAPKESAPPVTNAQAYLTT